MRCRKKRADPGGYSHDHPFQRDSLAGGYPVRVCPCLAESIFPGGFRYSPKEIIPFYDIPALSVLKRENINLDLTKILRELIHKYEFC